MILAVVHAAKGSRPQPATVTNTFHYHNMMRPWIAEKVFKNITKQYVSAY